MAGHFLRYFSAKHEKGQVMIEFAIAFPVLIIVALIMLNALLFASDCARFDNLVRDSIRTHAASPSFDENPSSIEGVILGELHESFSDNLYTLSLYSTQNGSYHTYTAELHFYPTYFSQSPLKSVFNVVFAPLKHECSLTVDTYKESPFSYVRE